MLAIFGDTKYNKFSNTKFEGTCVYGICRTKPAAGGLPAMRRPGWLSCARGRGPGRRGMRASARAVFAAGTSEIEKKKAGNVLTNITCLCFHYTIDEYGVSSLRKGRKCERNPSGVSFAFNSRAQATVFAADRFRSNKKRHAEACLFLLCFHYTIDERGDLCFRKGRKCERNPSGVPFAFNSRPQAARSAKQTTLAPIKKRHAKACLFFIVLSLHYR